MYFTTILLVGRTRHGCVHGPVGAGRGFSTWPEKFFVAWVQSKKRILAQAQRTLLFKGAFPLRSLRLREKPLSSPAAVEGTGQAHCPLPDANRPLANRLVVFRSQTFDLTTYRSLARTLLKAVATSCM
jgi:hypothetical protein